MHNICLIQKKYVDRHQINAKNDKKKIINKSQTQCCSIKTLSFPLIMETRSPKRSVWGCYWNYMPGRCSSHRDKC